LTLPGPASPGLARKDFTGKVNPSERIDELIAATPDWRGATIARLRRIVHEADPEIIEEWKWLGSPVFSHGGIVCVITILKNKVKMTLPEGARLADPDRLFNAGLEGNKWRAIDICEGDKINESALEALIRSGVEHNIAKAESAGSISQQERFYQSNPTRRGLAGTLAFRDLRELGRHSG
jgi:hypothetical protein